MPGSNDDFAARHFVLVGRNDLTMAHTDKAEGARTAGWVRRNTVVLYEDEFQRLRQDTVDVKGKGSTNYTYQERPEGVLIVPVTAEGLVLLIRQYRYAVDAWGLEVPAGGTQDTGDMPLLEVARKELREEVGGEAAEMRHVGWFYASGALSDEKCHVFLALGVRQTREPEREPTEKSITVQSLAIDEAMHLARTGGIHIGPSALALLLCERQIKAAVNPSGLS
jgi:ADP-ribose pyrophosphatase